MYVGKVHVFFSLIYCYLLVFHRKDLCEAKHEMQSVFKFSDVPPLEASSGQDQYYISLTF